ncbi:vWA domain-containing protein [Pseudobythopirellula maris]|nr:vWA domain-containing protein [Pseudobythopirellula maris]
MAALGLTALGALVATLLVASALLRPPQPIELVTVGAHYATNLSTPHNAAGWRGLLGASRLGEDAPLLRLVSEPLIHAAPAPLVADSRFEWRQAVSKLTGPTAVLIVSMHGGADDQGPYLLPTDCTPLDGAKNRLLVSDLLDELAELPAEQEKLVVLDAAAWTGDWRYGSLENRFAEGLRGLDARIAAIPNLVVLSSSDVGERSWSDPATCGNVFLEAFTRGLGGAADDTNDDGRLSAAELADYARRAVAVRVSTTRGRTQTPLVLPLGATGASRAAAMELAVADPHFESPPQSCDEPPLEAIGLRWLETQQLAAALMAPETTDPVAWRRYRRGVIRWEELLIAGTPELAAQVDADLDDWARQLLHGVESPSEASDPVQLSRPEEGGPLGPAADALVSTLWATPAEHMHKAWEDAVQAHTPSETRELCWLVYDRLLNRTTEDPQGALRRAAAVVAAMGEPTAPRPCEAHLLTLLSDGLPSDLSDLAWADALRLVIHVRRLSEDILTSRCDADSVETPAMLPWIQRSYREADAIRRAGEDELFGGLSYLPRATASLRDAEQRFVQIDQRAGTVHAAIGARDKAFDLLPFYSESAAAVVASDDNSQKEIAAAVATLEAAWDAANELGDVLLAVDSSGAAEDEDVEALTAATAALGKRMKATRRALDRWRSGLANRSGAPFWNNRPAALRVPDLEVGDRLKLLVVSHTGAPTPDDDASPVALAAERIQACRCGETERRGRLALASIGARLFDRALGDHNASQSAQASLAPHEGAHDPRALAPLAADLARALRGLLSSDEQELSTPIAADEPQEPAGHWAEHAAVERRLETGALEGAQAPSLRRFRRQRVCEFNLWRTERVMADRWNGALPGADPYYRTAAEAYLQRADQALPGRAEVARLRRLIATPMSLSLVGPSRVDVVSGATPPLSYRVVGAGGIGSPTVSVTTGEGLRVEVPTAGERFLPTIEGDDADAPFTVVLSVDSDAESDDEETVVGDFEARRMGVSVWLRGHRAELDSPIVIHHRPEFEADTPPAPLHAGLAIRAPETLEGGQRTGGVAFVLDASGSMGPVGAPGDSKYTQAVEALTSLLADTPAGVRVSVWVFGQAVGQQKTVEQAESTIECVLPPTSWDPQDTRLAQGLADRLAYPRVEPWNESPLTRAILAASNDLRDLSGYRAVIAITDGFDNRFASDALANPAGRPIAQVLAKELAGSGVAVQVVGFQVSEGELSDAREQFAFLNTMNPAGRWWEADKRHELEATLRRALAAPRSVAIEPEDPASSANAAEALLAGTDTNHLWQTKPLAPGVYRLPIGAGSAPAQRARLAGGDLLLLAMQDSLGATTLAPAPFAAERFPEKPARRAGDWRATLLNHRRLPDGSTSTMLCLEHTPLGPASPDALLGQTRPADLWIESPGLTGSAPQVGWRPYYGYPAPCWEVARRRHQSEESGPDQLAVWWSWPKPPAPSRVVRRGADYERLVDLVGKSWVVDGEPVEALRIAVERRRLPNADGPPTQQNCLVVELGAKAPYKVRLHGLETAGQRHKCFTEAGRSVGLFWPVDPERLDEAIAGLELVSIERMKREAEERGQSAKFPEVAPASPVDNRPTPAVDWLGAVGS